MAKAKARRDDMLPEYDFSKGVRGKFVKALANKRWWVTLDPELVRLLSGSSHPAARVLGLTDRKLRVGKRDNVTVPLTDEQLRTIRPLLERIGAGIEYVPLPGSAGGRAAHSRKAGTPRPRAVRD